MKGTPHSEGQLRRFLLGTLPEDERQGLEVELLRDDAFGERLAALEDEMLHDWAQGGHEAAALAPMVERLRSTTDGRRRVAAAQELVAGLGGRAPAAAPRPAWLAAAAAAVLLLAAATWLLRWRETAGPAQTRAEVAAPTPLPAATAALDAPSPPQRDEVAVGPGPAATSVASLPASRQALVVTLALAPGATRGDVADALAVLRPQATALRLLLTVPARARGVDALRFRAALLDADGVERWSRGGLRARPRRRAATLQVEVPADRVPEGDYEIALAVEGGGTLEPLADYAFRVLRER
jgi:hypothetical protein